MHSIQIYIVGRFVLLVVIKPTLIIKILVDIVYHIKFAVRGPLFHIYTLRSMKSPVSVTRWLQIYHRVIISIDKVQSKRGLKNTLTPMLCKNSKTG